MPKLRLEGSPAAALPLRFLLTTPCWGMAGGLMLCMDGDLPFYSRWHPATLALVHVWTLGVLGNAMFGSLLQFLPVAVGSEVRWQRSAPWLHALFNLGVLLLVAGLHGGLRGPLLAAGMVLPLAFMWLAVMTLPGLLGAAGERLMRAGIGIALGYGVATALVGGGMALRLAGAGPWPLAVVDVHAAFGVLGWMLLLLAAVGRLVMPMFQATGSVPARAQAAWLGSVALALPAAAAWHLSHGLDVLLPALVAVGAAVFALAGLWLQWPVPTARRSALFRHWRIGLLAMLLAAVALLGGGGLLAGALALGVGLPLLVGAMAMEIVPFIAWLGLRRRLPRGMQIPGVQRLLPHTARQRVLMVQALAAPWLVLAVLWPQPWPARWAGLGQLGAWGMHGHALWSALRSARGFVRRVEQPA